MEGIYAGVDWASEKHDVLVADAAGEKLLAATFRHDEPGLRSLCRELVRLGVELVAVERPDGLLVERLLDAGLRVLALHPNQVAATRDRFRPGPLGLFSDLNSRISLAFLERYPSPADARGLGEARLRAFLERQRYSGRQTPARLLAKLRRAAHGRVGELELATRRQLVLTLVATIKALNQQIKALERRIATAIRAHPDGAIFTSLFKGTVITAAELLAEIG